MSYLPGACSTLLFSSLLIVLPAATNTSRADGTIFFQALAAFILHPGKSAAIWKPKPETSWQWQLCGTINTTFNVQMYDIDLIETPAETIATLHTAGHTVICYLSAGSWEEYRPDANRYPAEVSGNNLDGWSDEKLVDYSQRDELGPILVARMDLTVSKGCDGIEPDNIDGHTNTSGFPLTAADLLQFN